MRNERKNLRRNGNTRGRELNLKKKFPCAKHAEYHKKSTSKNSRIEKQE